ncbi:MAG: YheT family hydrolase, partial [Planctomycetia bacterium]
MKKRSLPDFHPPRWLRGGHAQTLWPFLRRGVARDLDHAARVHAAERIVALPDGDAIVLHDESPAGWRHGDPIALLMHGLCGCNRSPYLVRIAAKLRARGVRSFRMDLRGCGAGLMLARGPYHSGRSEDLAAAVDALGVLCPDSPLGVAGFSLGGNIILKYLGETPERVPSTLRAAAAVNPPADLWACIRNLARPGNRLYDRYFVKKLWDSLERRRRLVP